MRIIKFRGLTLATKEMIYGLVNKSNQPAEYDDIISNYRIASNGENRFVIPETIGQFIGLHDKNGKEIYEGDMLRDDYTDEDILIEDYSVVVWDEKFCQWAIDNSFAKDGSSFTNLVEYFGRETFEIVGNIFENADLVKL